MSKTDKTIQEIVIARILTMPDNVGISIGRDGDFSKNEMIEHIKNDDEVGKKFVEIQLSYLQSLKDLTNQLTE
jgi:hypothetical protein